MTSDFTLSADAVTLASAGSSRGVEHPHGSVLRAAARTRRGQVGGALALLVILIAALGPLMAPQGSGAFVTTPFQTPSSGTLLGGDVLGRDVLSRVLDGGWELLLMAAAATAIGVVVGAVTGVFAAYKGGLTDTLMMRVVDVLLAFPQLVLALLLVSVIGPKVWLIVFAVALGHAPQVARVIRSAALDVCERDFVKAADLIALPPWRVMRREIMPNVTSPLMVESGLRFTYSIIIIAGLAFLGFGLPPPAPSWGVMINENRIGLTANPWSVLVPASLLAVLTVGVNTFTDAVARVGLGVVERPRRRRFGGLIRSHAARRASGD